MIIADTSSEMRLTRLGIFDDTSHIKTSSGLEGVVNVPGYFESGVEVSSDNLCDNVAGGSQCALH